VNLLLYSRNPPTFFGHPLWLFLGRCVYKGYITKTTTPWRWRRSKRGRFTAII